MAIVEIAECVLVYIERMEEKYRARLEHVGLVIVPHPLTLTAIKMDPKHKFL